MTSPALLVLCVALLCSTSGIASKGTTDHDMGLIMRTFPKDSKQIVTKQANYTDLNMEITRTNILNSKQNNVVHKSIMYKDSNRIINNTANFGGFYIDINSPIRTNLEIHRINLRRFELDRQEKKMNSFSVKFKKPDTEENEIKSRVRREDDSDKCEEFKYKGKHQKYIYHPHDKSNNMKSHYYSNSNCVTIISGADGEVIQLTFVDVFHIEYHPECAYDYLEIRDGLMGYAKKLDRVCGDAFPRQITTSGPHAWLKFKSDETIEYEGFHINVNFLSSPNSHSIPDSCYMTLNGTHGVIDSKEIKDDCKKRSTNLDVLWTIKTPPDTRIYLNFTSYSLQEPNECENNVIQVYGHELEFQSNLANYCGSVANPVTTKDEPGNGNIMYIRMYASNKGKDSSFEAKFTAYRTLKNDEHCIDGEFDCEDNTCIDIQLKCNGFADCRLKADEGPDNCKGDVQTMIKEPHIVVILVIFSLILSGMSFVFLFKCIRKLYQDHKIIKAHIKQSCEDRLDSLVDSRLTLDAKRLAIDSEPRASLERENHTNEMFKQQRKFSQQKVRPTSIDSDFIHETHLDLDDEPWKRDVIRGPIDPEDVRIERNGRTRKSDISKKEESIRSKPRESEERKEIRDASVGAPDTKESGCQTRESLFQTEPAPSSDGSGTTNSRGFSTFGYSGATIIRPSPPAPATNTSEMTIELLRQVTPHPEKPQKKFPDRRPISTETTRSAPDVIIVSKPIR